MKSLIKVLALSLVMVMMISMFASCFGGPNSDPDKAEEALEEAGYLVTNTTLGYDLEGLDTVVTGYKMNSLTDGDAIVILYFEDSKSAKEAWDELKDALDEEDEDDYVVKKSGKMIYAGTKQAVKDAK